MTPGLSIGVLLPTREQAMSGRFDGAALVRFAQDAEALGFDSVWAGDSVLARPRLDPLLVLSAVAAATTHVGLGTAAYTAILRQPAVGAHLVSSLAHLSGDRFVAGLGSGFPIPDTEEEFAALGMPFDRRAARLDDCVALWRAAWHADGPVDVHGRFTELRGADRLPRPPAPGGPPLWLAGSGTPAVVERVAARYDGWLPFLPTPADYADAHGRLQDALLRHRRPVDAVTPSLYATLVVGRDSGAARAELDRYLQAYYGRGLDTMAAIQAYGWGNSDDCARWLADYVRAGARHLVLRIGSLDFPTQLRRVASDVLPALRELVPTTTRPTTTTTPTTTTPTTTPPATAAIST